MKRKLLIFFYFLFVMNSICLSQVWYSDTNIYRGVVVQPNGQVLMGDIVYNQANESVLLKTKTKSNSFTPFTVRYFQFYDETLSHNRYFISIIDEKGLTKFYEYLLRGQISLFRKLAVVEGPDYENTQNKTVITLGSKIRNILFIRNGNDVITPLNSFKLDVLPLMHSYIKQISTYIIDNKLEVGEVGDQISIIDYYNQLVEK